MRLTLSDKEFTLRADFLAFNSAKEEAGVSLGDEFTDPVDACKLLYFMARSGAKYAGVPFKYELEDFLGLMQLSDVPQMTSALNEMMGAGAEKKS